MEPIGTRTGGSVARPTRSRRTWRCIGRPPNSSAQLQLLLAGANAAIPGVRGAMAGSDCRDDCGLERSCVEHQGMDYVLYETSLAILRHHQTSRSIATETPITCEERAKSS